jgi:hypothetical protein
VAIIINEHTVSAGEMVAAFASENGLAKLVGTETAGRLIPGPGFKVGYGYMLVMPKTEYVTWGGATLRRLRSETGRRGSVGSSRVFGYRTPDDRTTDVPNLRNSQGGALRDGNRGNRRAPEAEKRTDRRPAPFRSHLR